ncbi:MAG: holo-ACP synthase [Clostridia bacterium]|nr:holo-ACP synthase [Clostridia bacterium]
MKICCGTDIIEIERIKKSIDDPKMGKAFVERVFTPKEIQYCESKKAQKYQHYAVRFAAKEATFKAISSQLENKYAMNWKDFEITNTIQGRPELTINGIDLNGIEDIDLSLSHCKEYAVANVTLLRK